MTYRPFCPCRASRHRNLNTDKPSLSRSQNRTQSKRIIRHEQWIEVFQKDGKTVSVFYPPNDEFERERLEMNPQPDYIYRRINFIHGVPPEYNWTGATSMITKYGGHFLQRILPKDWPEVMQSEALAGNQHLISASRPQPRPAELGPCPCDACTAERDNPNQESRYNLFKRNK